MTTILIVDDDPSSLFMLKELFEERGHRAITAITGADAKPPVVLILVDRRLVGFPRDVERGINDLLVIPARRELGLAGLAGPVPVPAAVVVAVEYVGGAIRADVDRV